jgi:hypothetical protein
LLLGLGLLEAEKDPELAKQHFYQAARLYADIDMKDWE